MSSSQKRGEHTILITKNLIEIELGLDELAVDIVELANEDGALEADVGGRVVERHI